MSVAALSRLLEAVAKSIKHATAMSTLLTAEIFQARWNAALASSKLLLDNSSFELRNTERKKKRRVNFIPKFHSSLKKIVKYFTMITKRYMYGTKVPNFIGL